MHYYKRNIGDYAKKAGRLTILQHGVYNLLIDACYDRERFPTLEEARDWLWIGTSEEEEALQFVLRKFFTLDEKQGVYVQARILAEILEYQKLCEVQAAKGRKGGRPKKPDASKENPAGFFKKPEKAAGKQTGPEKNPKPITTNHKPLTKNHSDYTPEFEDAWACYPKREGSNPKPAAFKAWRGRLSDGATPQEMQAGTLRYQIFCEARGSTGTEFVMQGARFYGPNREYENDWRISDGNGRQGNRQHGLSKSERSIQAVNDYLNEGEAGGGVAGPEVLGPCP